MCGIALRYRYGDEQNDDGFISRALKSISYRGPDGQGVICPVPGLEIGHKRLAIISPHDGQQPLVNQETGVTLSYNGEIYNYRDLRKELIDLGHFFKTECDTEVLLHAYLEYGIEFINKLNGMFGFVIWDPRTCDIYAVRDRVGIKPLYYYKDDQQLIVASEVKAILQDNKVKRKIDTESLYEYLIFGFTAGKKHLINEINTLQPGHMLHLDCNKKQRITTYWSLLDQQELRYNIDEACDLIDDTLRSSVHLRLRSDVPFAIILSGGLDSSLISHYADEQIKGLTAYSLRVADENYDETYYAKMVCENRSLDLVIVDIDGEDFASMLDEVTWYYDEPILQTNTVGLYKLCKQISSDGIKMLIGGEGADELFGGYSRHAETLLYLNKGFSEKLLYGRNEVAIPRVQRFWPDQKAKFLERENFNQKLKYLSFGQQILRNDQWAYLPHLLQRPDRMGMACNIEIRVPFLDHRLVELANSIPADMRFSAQESKAILKKTAVRFLPKKVINRAKLAFDTPISKSLLNGAMKNYFNDNINKSSIVANIFNIKEIKSMQKEFQRGKIELWRILWQILSLERYMKNFKCEL